MKFLIADETQTVDLFRTALKHKSDISIMSTNDGQSASKMLFNDVPPDVAILNCSLPKADGIELCKKLREQEKGSYTHVILVSDGNINDLFKAIANGFDRILIKPIDKEDLTGIMETLPATDNKNYNGFPETSHDALTKKQQEILNMLAEGYSNNEIAEKLGLSLGTIKSHIHHIFGKLSVSSRTKALLKAKQYGLL